MGKSEFGMRVKKLRMNEGLSMQDLGKLLGVNKSRINMWENSNSIPKKNILIKLSNVFNVSIDYLLGNEEMEDKVPDSIRLQVIQRKLEKLNEEELKKVEKLLDTIFENI